MDAWLNVILTIVGTVLTTVLGLLAAYIQSKFTGEQIIKGKSIAEIVVRSVEQIASTLGYDISGEAKYAMATKFFVELSKKAGLNFNYEQVKALIESAVASLNQFWDELTPPPIEPPVVPPPTA